MTQERWPFENSVLGIAVHAEFRGGGVRMPQPYLRHEEDCPALDQEYDDPELRANGVISFEGRQ